MLIGVKKFEMRQPSYDVLSVAWKRWIDNPMYLVDKNCCQQGDG